MGWLGRHESTNRVPGAARRRPAAVVLATMLLAAWLSTAAADTPRDADVQPAASTLATPAVGGTAAPVSTRDSDLEAVLRRLGVATAAYRMTDVLAGAQACRGLAQTQGKLAMAMLCNERAYRAARVLGDAHAFIEAAHWQSGHADARGLDAAFAEVDLKKLMGTIPPFSVAIDGGSTRLDYAHPLTARVLIKGHSIDARGTIADLRPVVPVTIDGKQVQALVDTGAPVALVLDRKRAHLLGAVTLVEGARAPRTFGVPDPKPGSAAYALVDSLKLGTLTMHGVLAVVLQDGKVPASGVIVGLPLLAQYQQATFTRSQLELDTDADTCARKALPMTATLAARGGFGMTFPAEADGRDATAMFDTGMSFPVAVGPMSTLALTLPPATSKQPVKPAFTVHPNSHKFRIGSINLLSKYVYVPKLEIPVDFVIGTPMLFGADVQLDFATLSLCVTPRKGRASR